MAFNYKSDEKRYSKIKSALSNPSDQNRDDDWTDDELYQEEDLTKIFVVKDSHNNIIVHYGELWSEACLVSLFKKPEYADLKPLMAIQKFYKERFTAIAEKLGLTITDYDIYPTSYNGEAILSVDMVKYGEDKLLDEIIAENEYQQPKPVRTDLPIDSVKTALPQGGTENVAVKADNRFNQVYMTDNKQQDPTIVDRQLKSVFEEKFKPTYSLTTDVGKWHPTKTLKTDENKFIVHWEHGETNKLKIITEFFPKHTNNINVVVQTQTGEPAIKTQFEVYRIPTDAFLCERFIRKVYFSLLKKFINSQVIKQEPFRRSFVFWQPHNPTFSYSFSEPKKNQIVLDLIGFIKTARKPILDDFFEQHNLRHKQGYLQTLLDASEDAGIFDFIRQGNEVLVNKGANFKAFLEGRIRKF